MKEFKRTWEKVLAWIANVIMLLSTVFVGAFAFTTGFSGFIELAGGRAEFERELTKSIAENPALAGQKISTAEIITILDNFFRGYTFFLAIFTVVAIVATLLIRKRILSGVLFLILAVVTVLATFTVLWFVSLAYLIVAILLFVRKEPKNLDPFDPNNPNNRVDKIEYV